MTDNYAAAIDALDRVHSYVMVNKHISFEDLCDAFNLIRTNLAKSGTDVPNAPQWMPIETAPRDGETFLVCFPRMMNLIIRARYNTVHKYFITDKLDGNSIDTPAFFHDGDLWMPLPAAPVKITAATDGGGV